MTVHHPEDVVTAALWSEPVRLITHPSLVLASPALHDVTLPELGVRMHSLAGLRPYPDCS